MKGLALLVCLLVCVWSAEAHVYGACPSGWTYFGLSCYMFYGQASNRITSENICRQFSGCGGGIGHLVSINTREENNFVSNFIKNVKGTNDASRVWLGGLMRYDRESGDFMWRWSDGTPINANTFNAFPSMNIPQDREMRCMIFSENVQPEWMAINCAEFQGLPFMCELKANIPDPETCQPATPTGNNPISPLHSLPYKSGNMELRDNGRP